MILKSSISKLLSVFSKNKKSKNLETRDWDSLCSSISYTFQNKTLLRQAMTHRSYLQENAGDLVSNERLEFLGDAVLGALVSEELFLRFPNGSEGELTRAKSYLVSRESLAKHAETMNLGSYL